MHTVSPRQLTVTVRTTAKLLELGMTTVWGLISSKELETIHVGKRTLVVFASIERFVERRQQLNRKAERSEHPPLGICSKNTTNFQNGHQAGDEVPVPGSRQTYGSKRRRT